MQSQTNLKISGQIVDSINKPIDGVIVSLIKYKNSALVKTTFTDNDGKFEFSDFKSDSLKIFVTNIGFQNYFSDVILIDSIKSEIKLPNITLSKMKNVQLSEVSISSKVPFIERKIDRTIVNPDALISNAGSNALDVLAKSPGVMVTENGTIKLKGKSGVIIINEDKQNY